MELPQRTLLEWVLDRYPDTPRTRAKQWIVSGRVTVDGSVVRQPQLKLAQNHGLVALQGRDAALVLEQEWRIHARLALIHIDPALAIVNKGAGLLSVPAPHSDISALSVLADFLGGRLRAPGGAPAQQRLPPMFAHATVRPVHRLDQFTTGVLCLALSPLARTHLIAQFQSHGATRQYLAYVDGRPPAPRGTWRHWLLFDEATLRQQVLTERQAQSAGDAVQDSITHYEVVDYFTLPGTGRVISKLRLNLETGRTHQIRAQAAHEGLPLIGDRVYHPLYHLSNRDRGAEPVPFSRQALHAEALELEHPDQPGKRFTWRAALPDDLRKLERTLRTDRR